MCWPIDLPVVLGYSAWDMDALFRARAIRNLATGYLFFTQFLQFSFRYFECTAVLSVVQESEQTDSDIQSSFIHI